MVKNIVKIQIVDSGKDKYLIKTQPFVLGRQYENNATEIQIERPSNEKDSACFLVATNQYGEVLDHIDMTNNKCLITNNLSKHKRIYIGFYFSSENDYLKGSEIATCDFLPSPKPDGFVPVEPEQKKNFDYLIAHGFTNSRLNGNTLEFFNMNGKKVVSFDLSPFMQAQSDLGETDENSETFVKGKKTSNLENDSGFITKAVKNLENYYDKQNSYSKSQVDEQIKNEVSTIAATQIRNKQPNLVIEVTSENVQTIATQYIVDNYERQPQEYDGLYLTFTDHENQVVEYAFHNGSWVTVGFDKVDLSNYMDLVSEQNVKGRKIFEDESHFKKPVDYDLGIRLNDSEMLTTDTNSDSVVKYGATGIHLEKGGDTKEYLQQFQENSGFIALLEQTINKILKHSIFKNIDLNGQKEDTWSTNDADTTLSMTHENETTHTSISTQKGYAEMSAFGVGEDTNNSSISVTTDTILLTSAEARVTGSKNTTMAITNDGATINGDSVILNANLTNAVAEINNSLKDKLNVLGLGETNRVYIRATENKDSSLPFTYTAEGSSIVYRNASGRTQVETPTQSEDAANKGYVDNLAQHYLSLYGESGILDDQQYELVTSYDDLIIQRTGIDFRRSGHPSNGKGDYVFISPYYSKSNGTEEFDAYIITIKQDRSWESTIKNFLQISEQTYAPVVVLMPDSATNGILSDDDYDNLIDHDDVRIKLNNEYYICMDDGHTKGIRSYVHDGWNGNSNQVKSINITLATKSWTLAIGKNKYYRHYIQLEVDGKALYYDFSSTHETAFTSETLPTMPDDIITAFQIVANGYYSSVSGLIYRNSENELKAIIHGMFTTNGTSMTYLQLAGVNATFVKDTVKEL